MTELVRRTTLAFQAGESPALLGLAAAALVLLVVLGIRASRGVDPRRRVVLALLRSALALAVVLIALRPALRRESLAVSASPVTVLVDTSASMGMTGTEDGDTRLARLARWTAARAGQFEALERTASVEWFATSGGALRKTSREEIARSGVPASGGTDLSATLAALAERHPGRDRPPVILLSDGADHGALAVAVAAGAGLSNLLGPGGPIFAVAPAGGAPRNLAVAIVAHDPVGFLRTDVTVRVNVSAEGLEEADVPVSLLAGEEILAVRSVKVGGPEHAEAEVTFTLKPTDVGEVLHRVSIPTQPGEAVLEDNAAEFSVRVVRDRLRVLQIVGRPSWDGRFLREVLKRNPAIDLISFFILRNAWDDTGASIEELSLIPFPVSELFTEKLEGFDLVIFQNFDLAPYSIGPHLGSLAHHVEENGAALCVIGGDLAFGQDYRTPEFARLLPAVASPRAAWSGASFRVEATDAGRRHPALFVAGDADGTESLADALPLEGLSQGLVPREGALVLLETSDARHAPVVVAGTAGRGRVLVVASDGTWRWSLPSAGQPSGPRGYEAFWESAIRWLVKDPRAASLLIEADRRTVGPGESVELRAALRRAGGAALAGETITVLVRAPGESVATAQTVTTGEDGVARLVLEPAHPGFHEIRAEAGEATAGPVYVRREDEGRELADPRVRLDLLEALAKATGGAVVTEDEPGLDLPFETLRDERLEGVTLVPLWNTWTAFGLIAGLACLEWWLRRRWGLA